LPSFRRLEQLIRAFIEVNAEICRARSAQGSAGIAGKNDGRSLAGLSRLLVYNGQ